MAIMCVTNPCQRARFFQIITSGNTMDTWIHSFVFPVAQSIARAACHPTKLQQNLEGPRTSSLLALCFFLLLLHGIEGWSHPVSSPPAPMILRKAYVSVGFAQRNSHSEYQCFLKGKKRRIFFFSWQSGQ